MTTSTSLLGNGMLTQAEYDQFTHMATMGTALNIEQKSSSTVCFDDANIPLFDLAEIISSKGQERSRQVEAFGDALKEIGFVAIKAEEITPPY